MLFHPHAHLGMIRSAENEDGWFWKNKPTVGTSRMPTFYNTA